MKEFAVTPSKKKMITDCRSFTKDGSVNFAVEYISREATGKTYLAKDGTEKNELKKCFKNIFFSRSELPKEFDNVSDDEICQVLKGKSLVTQTLFTD